jgi:hypothetical protein
MMQIRPTEPEIDAVLNLATDQMDKGGSAYPGMSFEEGVQQGISWVLGLGDLEAPLP